MTMPYTPKEKMTHRQFMMSDYCNKCEHAELALTTKDIIGCAAGYKDVPQSLQATANTIRRNGIASVCRINPWRSKTLNPNSDRFGLNNGKIIERG